MWDYSVRKMIETRPERWIAGPRGLQHLRPQTRCPNATAPRFRRPAATGLGGGCFGVWVWWGAVWKIPCLCRTRREVFQGLVMPQNMEMPLCFETNSFVSGVVEGSTSGVGSVPLAVPACAWQAGCHPLPPASPPAAPCSQAFGFGL